MSGAVAAIRGFDYQATVILDLLFDHFDRHGRSASVRPEGEDDLDLQWNDAGVTHRRFVQVKKPTENERAEPKPSPWSMSDIVRELLPQALVHLAGNDREQIWVLGDAVTTPVRELFTAGAGAPSKSAGAYWSMIHSLARADAEAVLSDGSALAEATARWRVPNPLSTDPVQAQADLVAAAMALGQRFGPTGTLFARRYAQEAARLHSLLPGALDRIKILDANGAEIDLAKRVMQRLEQRYRLSRPVIEHTVFRNLRGFINDIAKQPGRSFDLEELELEMRCVWPEMVPVKMPPPLEDDHVMRPALAADLADPWTGAAIEVVGISGSGKTRLAGEILERSLLVHPERLALYSEVRAGVSLRDCLAGAAFRLRRLGVTEPFGIAVEPDRATESVLIALAKAFAEMPGKCLLLLDFVEGGVPPGFARDLAAFIRNLPANTLRLIVFGQERVLRELTDVEQMQLGVRSFDAPGLSFEEFVTLVRHRHAEPDRTQLWSLYQQITVGRAAGLNVSLARALARAQTADERLAIVARPAEDRLPYAEQSRFARLSGGARTAAEKLTCFAQPFRRVDAESVFAGENVGLAMRELLDLALLRRHDGEAFEMHETVRAGLEELIAPQTRRDAHSALATWYREQAQIGAAVFHLERAGRSEEARAEARQAFRAGENWPALWPYVARHRLVSVTEIVAVLADSRRVEGAYLLSDILNELGNPPSAQELMDLVRDQGERVVADPQWARPIMEAILVGDPSRLDSLIEFMIQAAPSPETAGNALTWLSIAARRRIDAISASTLALFDRQSEAIQRSLLGFLLRGGRPALTHALRHLYTHPELLESGRNGGWATFGLDIRSSEDVEELLAAIPMASPADMIRARGPLFRSLSGLVWRARKALRSPCVAVLKAQALDSDALVNAIRILILLGEPTILELCEPLHGRADGAGALSNLVCAIVPAMVDWCPYEMRVLNRSAEFPVRAQALINLAWSGRRLEDLLDQLQAMEASEWSRWGAVLRIIAPVTPFAAAIPILEDALASGDDQRDVLLPSIMARQGQTPGANVTAALARALSHRNAWVRLGAVTTLARRRDRAALPRLIERYGQEESSEVQAVLATAILASGAPATADLAARSGTPATDLWWCVLAHRTRDATAAERLVSLAIDPDQSWQVRRAAIAAAGRLPYEAALSHIEAAVMAERSPLVLDRHRDLLAHDAVAAIAGEAARGLEQYYRDDRAGFIGCFEPYFEGYWKRTLDRTGLPTAAHTAGWLYDSLAGAGEPKAAALARLLDALHKPLLQGAVLRSLRLCERPDRIDTHLAGASHVWLAVRALLERSKFPERGPVLGQRLQALVAGFAWTADQVVKQLLGQLATVPIPSAGSSPAAVPTPAPRPSPALPLTYHEAVRVLSSAVAHALPDGPLALEVLTADECEALIRLADPTKDPERGETVFAPGVAFTTQGHQVSQRRTTYRGGPSVQDRVRPAIAAANRFGLPTPWHAERLQGLVGDTYASDFLGCLAVQGDDQRFYAALAEAEDVLMPILCQRAQVLSAQLKIDDRLIPALTRFLAAGGDDFFEGLCILAKPIDIPTVQPVLEGLLHRWIQRFDAKSDRPQNDEAIALWRGFARLSEHPRFNAIPDWPQQLEGVLRTPMAWYRAQSIVRVLERDPASYVLIEARLFKEGNWEHCREDEVERLDRAAEALFGQFQDSRTARGHGI